MDIPAGIRQTLDSLEAAGYEACVVGGCVRDHLLGVVPHDWDIATSATPPQVAEALAGARLIPTGIAHGTWTLLLPDLPVEITSYRADGPYLDNRHPQEVRYAPSLQEDLARRDFTLNAIAYHPQRGFSDPFGGRDDISAQLLRAVGQPQLRLSEDALRIMRALRFAATIGFAIEDQLAQALHEQRQLLANIAVERLSAELIRMLPGANILPVLLEYPDVLAVFIPEIAPTIGFDQQTKYHQYDVWEHSAHAVALAAPDPLVRLTLLLHDLGKPECFFTDADGVGHFYGHDLAGERIARKRLKALHFDSKTIQTVSTLIAEHQARFKLENVHLRLRQLGEPVMRLLFEVKYGDMAAHADLNNAERLAVLARCKARFEQLLAEGAAYRLSDLAVDGNDLLSLGYAAGPAIGASLDALLDAVVDGQLANERQTLLAAATSWLAERSISL